MQRHLLSAFLAFALLFIGSSVQGSLAAVPEPSLDHPLDFGKVMDERASDPAAWPEPYADADGRAALVEVEPGHFVLRSSRAAAA